MIPKIYKGEFSVIQCKGALASLTVAMKSVTPAKRQKSMLMNLLLQIERLSTGKRSVELSVRKEGELPSYNGKPKKKFLGYQEDTNQRLLLGIGKSNSSLFYKSLYLQGF